MGLGVHGGDGGDASTVQCPENQMVSGISGATGAEVDRSGVTCASLTGVGALSSYSLARTDGETSSACGGGGGGALSYLCPDGGVVTGVYGARPR